MNLQQLALQLFPLLLLIHLSFSSPFKIFKRHYLPSGRNGESFLSRIRDGRNSKVMLFDHVKGPITVSPISVKQETTTHMTKGEGISKNKGEKEETTPITDAIEMTTEQNTEDIGEAFQTLLGLNDLVNVEEDKDNTTGATKDNEKDVSVLLADLEKAIAKVDADYESDLQKIEKKPIKGLETDNIGLIENDLSDELIEELFQKDRLPKDHESKFDIEHSFSLEDDDDILEDVRSADPQNDSIRKGDVELSESPILQIKQQVTPVKIGALRQNIPQQQHFNKVKSEFPLTQGGFSNNQLQRYNNQNNYPQQPQSQGFFDQNKIQNQQFTTNQQQQIHNLNQEPNVGPQQHFNNQNLFSVGVNGQTQFSNNQQFGSGQQFYSQAIPRQVGEGQERATLFNNFGDAMGEDANIDPERNQFVSQTQLIPRQQAEGNPALAEDDKAEDEEVRCINKVMQVEEIVYEKKIKCQHTFTEKCHDTFITDYIPTQERKCETSFKKNCHITYKPMMFEETVELCSEPLEKVCNNETEGKGPEICKTHYETNCETRFKEHEVEQDEPVCRMVIERKCNDVRVPVPGPTGFLRRKKRQVVDGNGLPTLTDNTSLEEGTGVEPSDNLNDNVGNFEPGILADKDLLSIGEECEEWPVQQCTLEKKTVKKTHPETSCQKMPREICAPGNCLVKKSAKVCRTESRNLLQNIPSEQCDLEPQENCKMETVLVPRLVQQPNCVKVPKEICVNAKSNPMKVTKPVVKEWCYKPSDLKAPSTRLALAQFFSN